MTALSPCGIVGAEAFEKPLFRHNEGEVLGLLGQLPERMDPSDAAIAMHTGMNERFDRLEFRMKLAWQDIASNERCLRKHEREPHRVG